MKAFVLGHPIEHSLSPVLHRAAYDFLGQNISYQRLDTELEEFSERLLAGQRNSEICGYSVTMPLKKLAASSVQNVSDLGKTVGVVNTVFWREIDGNRQSFGHNTDISGIVNALLQAGLAKRNEGRFAILGGGGTAISALVAGHLLGYSSLDIYVRNTAKVQDLFDIADQVSMTVQVKELKDFPASADSYESVISTLPAGVADNWVGNILTVQDGAVMLDVSYDPWPSVLAEKWLEQGGAVVSGLEMLLYQALEQVKLFLGMETNDRFEDEIGLLNAMAISLNLEPRNQLPLAVTDLSLGFN